MIHTLFHPSNIDVQRMNQSNLQIGLIEPYIMQRFPMPKPMSEDNLVYYIDNALSSWTLTLSIRSKH